MHSTRSIHNQRIISSDTTILGPEYFARISTHKSPTELSEVAHSSHLEYVTESDDHPPVAQVLDREQVHVVRQRCAPPKS